MAESGHSILASDSDEGYVTKISETHLKFLKERLIKHITDSDEFSAVIRHVPDQPANFLLSFGSRNRDEPSGTSKPQVKRSNKLLVTGVPDTENENDLERFFAYTKLEGGGPVKSVEIYKRKEKKLAIIEFENSDAVNTVLNKHHKKPITIRKTPVDVEEYTPYIWNGEVIGSVELIGLSDVLKHDIETLMSKDESDVSNYKTKITKISVWLGACVGLVVIVPYGLYLLRRPIH